MMLRKENNKLLATLNTVTVTHVTSNGNNYTITSLTQLQLNRLHAQYSNVHTTFTFNIVKAAGCVDVLYEDLHELCDAVLKLSVPTVEDIDTLTKCITVIQDAKYNKEDYLSCCVCKSKGMDKIRNCPMLPKDSHSASVIYTYKDNDKRIDRVCPMYDVNNSKLLNPALELLRMIDIGSLPVSGGMLDQTPFVNIIIPILTPILDKKRIPQSIM